MRTRCDRRSRHHPEAVDEKSNEIIAIPALLSRPALAPAK
jgi:hypothetical protein